MPSILAALPETPWAGNFSWTLSSSPATTVSSSALHAAHSSPRTYPSWAESWLHHLPTVGPAPPRHQQSSSHSSSHHLHPTSFYFDCHPPEELRQAFFSNSIAALERATPERKSELRRWIKEKFDICGTFRRIWERRRFTEDLPSDRACQNEYFLQGGQNMARGSGRRIVVLGRYGSGG